jgi:hypothetical protein
MNVLVNFAIMCVGISSVLWSKTGKVSIMFILCYIICNTFMLNMETKLLYKLTDKKIQDKIVLSLPIMGPSRAR